MSSSKRLTFLSTVHPHPWAPTKGTFNASMLQALTSHFEVSAIVPVPWHERRPTSPPMDLPVYPVGFPTFWYVPRLARGQLARFLSASLRPTLSRHEQPDLVLSYWADPDGAAALEWARRIDRPFALIVGGSDLLLLAEDRPRRERILGTIRAADRVLAVGTSILARLHDLGLPPERTRLLRRGIDRERFRPVEKSEARTRLQLAVNTPTLLWVGRLVDVKGVDVLLQAMNHPALGAIAPQLLLVGDGPLRNELTTMAERLGINDRVHFVGPQLPEDLLWWYGAADVVVLPSRSEGVPNVLLEASACGRPFIASDVGGVRDLSENPELELVPPGSASALAERIAQQLESQDSLGNPMLTPLDSIESAALLAKDLLDLT